MYVLVHPATAERLGDVNGTEQHETKRSKRYSHIRRTINKQGRQTCHPRSEILIDDDSTRILAPIALHDIVCPHSKQQRTHHKSERCHKKPHWRKQQIKANPRKESHKAT